MPIAGIFDKIVRVIMELLYLLNNFHYLDKVVILLIIYIHIILFIFPRNVMLTQCGGYRVTWIVSFISRSSLDSSSAVVVVWSIMYHSATFSLLWRCSSHTPEEPWWSINWIIQKDVHVLEHSRDVREEKHSVLKYRSMFYYQVCPTGMFAMSQIEHKYLFGISNA